MKPLVFTCIVMALLASCKVAEKTASSAPQGARRTVVYKHPTVYRELGGFTHDSKIRRR